mmetsp:Transcript_22621/g.63042  ORF Transcript_22621/g.63042 Transcript_22621/m.63042 type:complete len:424 (+) Transcript_22621:195-1466(+)
MSERRGTSLVRLGRRMAVCGAWSAGSSTWALVSGGLAPNPICTSAARAGPRTMPNVHPAGTRSRAAQPQATASGSPRPWWATVAPVAAGTGLADLEIWPKFRSRPCPKVPPGNGGAWAVAHAGMAASAATSIVVFLADVAPEPIACWLCPPYAQPLCPSGWQSAAPMTCVGNECHGIFPAGSGATPPPATKPAATCGQTSNGAWNVAVAAADVGAAPGAPPGKTAGTRGALPQVRCWPCGNALAWALTSTYRAAASALPATGGCLYAVPAALYLDGVLGRGSGAWCADGEALCNHGSAVAHCGMGGTDGSELKRPSLPSSAASPPMWAAPAPPPRPLSPALAEEVAAADAIAVAPQRKSCNSAIKCPSCADNSVDAKSSRGIICACKVRTTSARNAARRSFIALNSGGRCANVGAAWFSCCLN